jgi:opacity protein-like surface antigen
MRVRTSLRWSAAVSCVLCTSTPAWADATAFVGVNTTPANRFARGVAVGVSMIIVGFEFEYSDTAQDDLKQAPSLRTGMFNMLVQTPGSGTQFYVTAGGGLYRERLETMGSGGTVITALQETHVGINIGGGVKFSVIGPLRVRLDYRVFRLRGEPLHENVQRLYAGVNLAF